MINLAWKRSRAGLNPIARSRGVAVILVLLGIALLTATALDHIYPLNLPADDGHFARTVNAANGEPLRAFADRHGLWRYRVAVDDVAPAYVEAVLGYEDQFFWSHPGINPWAIVRALAMNARCGCIVSGGSTLTMQVARLLHPVPRDVRGKFVQMLRALQLEWHLHKTEILELYLNYAPFGGTIEGVGAASHGYLNKSPGDLTHAEAALLAVLPQAPSRYRPDRFPQRAEHARNKVLERMRDRWPAATIVAAKLESVDAIALSVPRLAPLLSRRLLSETMPSITSTLDTNLQLAAEDLMAGLKADLPPGVSGAMLVVDNRTLKARVYVGSVGLNDYARAGHVDMVRAIRSPGSTLKPLLYGLAVDRGIIHSASLLSDAPRSAHSYQPQNFDRGFNGPVDAATALRRSLNVPAVNLLEAYQPVRFVRDLGNAGLALTLPADGHANLSIVLGGVGTSLEHLVGTYAGLARGGRSGKVRLRQGEPLTEYRLMSAGAAWITLAMLSEYPYRGRQQIRRLGATPLAYKTGTSYGYRDAWAIGVTPDFTAGVWFGRPDATPLPGHYGATSALPVLKRLMAFLPHQQTTFLRPENVSKARICWPLGTRVDLNTATECERQLDSWVLNGQTPTSLRSPYLGISESNPVSLWVDAKSGQRVLPACAVRATVKKTVALYPRELEPWVKPSWRRRAQLPQLATACAHIKLPANGNIHITSPAADALIVRRGAQVGAVGVRLRALGGQGVRRWFINGRTLEASLVDEEPIFVPLAPGHHQLSVVDALGHTDSINFEVADWR